ncbi:MAG: hypothetical protein HY548_07540 [Elusimicrobia bacterium]|nr:hypothetical protein [Elusimicrobiota bacterium]
MGTANTLTEGHAAYGMPAQLSGRPIFAAGGFLGQSIAPGVHQFDLYGGAATDVPTRGRVPWPVRGGGALKIRSQNGGARDPNIGKSKMSFGLDAGVLVKFREDLTVGAALRDLFPSGAHPQGPQLRTGLRYRHDPRILLLADLELRRNLTALRAGVEWFLYRDLLRLRLGNGFGSGTVDHMAVGAGFNFSPAQIDVAYLIPMKTFNDRSDQVRISLVYRFNAPKFSELYFDRALDMAEELDRKVADLEGKQAQLKAAVDDLEQARRLAEEELARASVRKTEELRGLEENLLQAQARASDAEKRVRELEGKVQAAEETLRRADRVQAQQRRAAEPKPEGPVVRTHIAQAGESLRSLAEKYYNDPERWEAIYNANRDKVDRGRPIPGEKLVIP